MRKRIRPSRLALLLLAFTVLFAAGCQAVGGLDLNKTLLNAMKVTSSESNQTLEFKLDLNEDVLAEDYLEEEIELIKLLSNIKLDVKNAKLENESRLSLEGRLVLGEKAEYDIGFNLKMNEKTMVVHLDGAKQPFTFDLTGAALLEASGLSTEEQTGNSAATDQASMTKLGFDIADQIGGYVINNLPNPKGLKVEASNQQINGVSTPLMGVQFEMDGSELFNWFRSYVDALVADKAGLEKMVKGIIGVLKSNPEYWEAIGEANPLESGELDAPTADEIAEEASTFLYESIVDLKKELDSAEEESEELSIDQLLGGKLNLKVNVYVDQKLDIRKQQVQISFKQQPSSNPEESYPLPFSGFTLSTSEERWNVNSSVKADAPEATPNAVSIEEASLLEGYQAVKLFDDKSDIYDLLKNKLHITRQEYYTFNDEYYNPPIILPGYITIVPVRDVADQFGATTTYNAKTKTVVIFDEATNTTIELKRDSDIVVVNGQKQTWPASVTSVEGTLYAPARKLAEALGASIAWEPLSDGKMLVIEREL
ncbi:copper amine oxidase N-terminal domain-containing protein [Paenibacillus sp. GCM10027627]|uniref:copper amine oxidase N-terminal domain-containing protein n=1 Tax=unclassified Paenibacillus TaxID=185978 RepID=UPI00363EEA98